MFGLVNIAVCFEQTILFFIFTKQVFFRAGVLGQLEDLRDERLSKIISMFQAFCKGYLMRKEYKKMCDQRLVQNCAWGV